jgi:alkanesulfonate monooxygenase
MPLDPAGAREPLSVFSTCPSSATVEQRDYFRRVVDVARWSDAAGCEGILVYTDNGLVDPWAVSQIIIEHTEQLAPLVAIQPVYSHPYTVAKKIATLAWLYGRRVHLNMLAGGFKNDLVALGDETPHDDRYLRTTEYTLVIAGLLRGEAVRFEGKYYRVDKLKLVPAVPPELRPRVLISGSSDAGLQAARAIGAVAVRYPKPAAEYLVAPPADGVPSGVRVGIIARDSADEAWRVAHERFPQDRRGQLTHQLAMKVSDSHWHRELSSMGADSAESGPYWLFPFENFKTFCPYLVGDYETVAEEVSKYLRAGFRTYILDIPVEEADLLHARTVFERAEKLAAR